MRRAQAGTFSNPPNICRVLQVGDKAPDFKLPTTGGQELTLADALQKYVIEVQRMCVRHVSQTGWPSFSAV